MWRLMWGIALLTILGNSSVAAPIQFVVAEFPGHAEHGDSYVITIDSEDASRLNHARALVDWITSGADPSQTPGAPIVVANIAAGPDGINRNYLADGQPEWSWHVTGPVNFADNTIEILDGWPTFVEQDVEGWLANTNSAIGFWNYTVVQELSAVPEPATSWLTVCWMPALLRRVRGQW